MLCFLSFAGHAAAVDAECHHILVKDEFETKKLKEELDESTEVKKDFEALAKKWSTCPSGKNGGSLGTFSPGQMVKEFDEVVFKTGTVGKVSDPVKTQFGWHLLLITRRGDEKWDGNAWACPFKLELCSDAEKILIPKFEQMPANELKSAIKQRTADMEAAAQKLNDYRQDLKRQREAAEKAKMMRITHSPDDDHDFKAFTNALEKKYNEQATLYFKDRKHKVVVRDLMKKIAMQRKIYEHSEL